MIRTIRGERLRHRWVHEQGDLVWSRCGRSCHRLDLVESSTGWLCSTCAEASAIISRYATSQDDRENP